MQDNVTKLQSDVRRLEHDLAGKISDVKDTEQRLSAALATADEAERRSTDFSRQLQLVQGELSSAHEAFSTAQSELATARQQLADLIESHEIDARANDSALELETLTREHADVLERVHAETARLEADLQLARSDSISLRGQVDDAKAQTAAIVSEHQIELSHKDKAASALEHQVSSLESTVVSLRRELDTPLDESNERVRTAAKALAQRLAMDKANEAHRLKKQHDALQTGTCCRHDTRAELQRTRSSRPSTATSSPACTRSSSSPSPKPSRRRRPTRRPRSSVLRLLSSRASRRPSLSCRVAAR